MKSTERGIIVKKYLQKYKKENKFFQVKTLARIIIKENPNIFNKYKDETQNLEDTRCLVRYHTGLKGDKDRQKMSDKSLNKPPRYEYDSKDTYLQNKDSEQYLEAKKRKLTKSKYYLITSAQNNSKIHENFWLNILAYKNFLNAEIHVVLNRYKNPTSTSNFSGEYWDNNILPYADAKRHKICNNLQLLSDIKIQPTAITPLTGLESISGTDSCIFGHPKVQLQVIPSLEGYEPKMMFTTGSVTKPNYTDSKAGKKGEFHHTYGFVIVEVKNNKEFFIRQVVAKNDGSFNDLIYNVSNQKVTKITEIEAAVLGDTHVGDNCPIVEKQQRKLLNQLQPKRTLLHDVFNGHSINHHEEKNPIIQYNREKDNSNNLELEIKQMLDWIQTMLKYNLVIVASNHNDWLDKYIQFNDWRKNVKNAAIYIKCANILLEGKAPKGLIAYFIDERFGKNIKTLGRSDSFKVKDIELSQHLDIGTNGSRGNVNQFKKLSVKMIGGHTHTPYRIDGVIYVGTSTKLRVGFNIGASSWKNADAIIHKDGKSQHIIYMGENKEFTTFF